MGAAPLTTAWNREMSTALPWPEARAQQKAQRRATILDATEALIRQTGSTEFSVGMLAERAGLSVATLYNLIGSKGSILYVLLNQHLDAQEAAVATATLDGDPFAQAIDAAGIVAAVFVRDPTYLRPLWRYQLGAIEPSHRPALMNRALALWERWLTPLERARCLPRGIGLRDLAREYRIYFAGALDLWVQDELDDAQFLAQIRYGCLLRLLALGDVPAQPRLLKDLQKTHRQLALLAKAAGIAPSA